MAEEMKSHDDQAVDKQDRGLFDFMKKDENSSKPHEQEAAAVSESADHFKEKVKIEDEKEKAHEKQEEEKKKPSLLEKLHRSNSSSSSSSSDEEGEGGEEKKKTKKKEKKKKVVEDTTVPVEKVEEHPEELGKKGFLEKIKDKLPGGGNKTQDQNQNQNPAAAEQHPHETSPTAGSDKEKKGFLDKIKEKLPGYQPSNTQDQTAGPQDHHSN